MKNWISRIVGVAMAALVCAPAILAQRDTLGAAAGDRYVISAKAGGVNFVSGPVGVVRTEGKSGQLLKGDAIEIGDRVSTGADGKAEILLNPGSYLRLGPLSAFEFTTTDLDNLQIKLDSGSAIFEVFATEDFAVTVNTPKAKFTLFDSGIYRVNADGTISVFKGKARIGDDEKAVVKSGREGSMANSAALIAKFDRDEKDAFDIWSKDRAKELAKISGRLERNTVRTDLMRSFLGRQWNMYNSFGLWIYDPFSRSNCFLPFGMGWGSPYGYGFGHSIWYYNLPTVVFTPPPTATGGPVVRQVKPGRNGVGPGPVRQPPFAAVQGSSGSTGREIRQTKPGRSIDPVFDPDPIRSGGGGFPSAGPPPSAPDPIRVPVRQSKPGRPID